MYINIKIVLNVKLEIVLNKTWITEDKKTKI